MLAELYGKRVLLLQGPMGPFFARLADELAAFGADPLKVNFNGGDALFYRKRPAIPYRGDLEGWPDWLEKLLAAEKIGALMLFGDGRPYHRKACLVAQELGIPVFVFEEGYLRPDFVTVEKGGVNGFSQMPRDPAVYRSASPTQEPRTWPVGSTFAYAAAFSGLYALGMALSHRSYPAYRHHRDLRPLREAGCWLRSGIRKLIYKYRERHVLARLKQRWSGRFFIVPLQVHNDHQLKHSRFESIESFIEEVVASFARHGGGDQALVIKHHPMDRGYRDYSRLIAALAQEHGLTDRLFYVHDLHLPTLLKHARGVVTINSTVGMSALHHGTPVKLLGTAVYDLEGLTNAGTLEAFWQRQERVDTKLWIALRAWMVHHNQAHGSFWRRLPGHSKGTGVRWPASFAPGAPACAMVNYVDPPREGEVQDSTHRDLATPWGTR